MNQLIKMMTIKSGVQKIKSTLKLLIISLLFITTHLNAENIDIAPLINLDGLEPSYDEQIIDPNNIEESYENSIFKKENKKLEEPYATVSLLNKITAKVKVLDINLKQKYLHEDLKIYAIDCYNSQPFEKKEIAVYLNVYNKDTMEKIFNGWMINSLPSISSMEHPIYDIWVDNCYKL